MEDEVSDAVGKTFLISGVHRHHLTHRMALYARGIAPGKLVRLVQMSPLGDPLIIEVDQQVFAVSRALWLRTDLEEKKGE